MVLDGELTIRVSSTQLVCIAIVWLSVLQTEAKIDQGSIGKVLEAVGTETIDLKPKMVDGNWTKNRRQIDSDVQMELRQERQDAADESTTSSTSIDDESSFFGALETNVTVSVGETAFLRCRLKANSPQFQVTWVRLRDWHILTSGLLTYTADARFRVKHALDTSEWTLEIKYLQQKDDGTYYCQVPTRTGTVVHAFHLHVASPQAVILHGDVTHVDVHTPSFTLVCIIDNAATPPQVVFWYHNGTLLTDGKYPERGSNGGLVSTHLTFTSSRAMSMLTLHNVEHVHSGNYTCSAPNAQSATTQLFVTQRHEQAAVHRSCSADKRRRNNLCIFLLVALASSLFVNLLTVR